MRKRHRGRRVTGSKWTGAPTNPRTVTIFAYDQDHHLIGEYKPDGTAITEYVWLGDTPVAVIKPAASGTGVEVFAIHTDHLDTPRMILDAQGQLRWRWMGEPFGASPAEELPTAGLAGFQQNLRFPGQQYEAFGGRHYNHFRDYDPTTGRYIQSDPIGLDGGINTYAYVGGNPVGFIDPNGLWITATYNHATKELHIYDSNTGTLTSGPFKSGDKGYQPLPNGDYDILSDRREDYFRLEPADEIYGDDQVQETTRGLFRLHKPGSSTGCITSTDLQNWQKMKKIIRDTSTDVAKVNSKSRNPFQWTEKLVRYGRITVINSPN